MRKFLYVILVLVSLFSVVPVFARDETRGASPTAYQHASDESIFIRVSDWFATVGKPEDEKDMIIAERRANRLAEQAKKDMRKASKKAGKAVKEFGKDLENAFK